MERQDRTADEGVRVDHRGSHSQHPPHHPLLLFLWLWPEQQHSEDRLEEILALGELLMPGISGLLSWCKWRAEWIYALGKDT